MLDDNTCSSVLTEFLSELIELSSEPTDFLIELLVFLDNELGVGEDSRLELVSELVSELLFFFEDFGEDFSEDKLFNLTELIEVLDGDFKEENKLLKSTELIDFSEEDLDGSLIGEGFNNISIFSNIFSCFINFCFSALFFVFLIFLFIIST